MISVYQLANFVTLQSLFVSYTCQCSKVRKMAYLFKRFLIPQFFRSILIVGIICFCFFKLVELNLCISKEVYQQDANMASLKFTSDNFINVKHARNGWSQQNLFTVSMWCVILNIITLI